MTTVTVNCAQCEVEFTVVKSQYKYQMKKNPKRLWFHDGSCSSTHRNNRRIERIGSIEYSKHLTPQYGNQHGRKYPNNLTWYIHRITTDPRSTKRAILTEEQRQEMVITLERLWNVQNGKCSISNVRLVRRAGQHGSVDTDNPFEIASIDRIDSELPYQEGNMQWVSVAINQAKGNLDDATFRKYAAVILNQ